MRKFFIGILIILAAFALIRGYYFLTDDFRIGNIIYPMDKREEWIFNESTDEEFKISQILNQEYTYIGKGAQCYAFGSQDGKYVLKFFKFKHLKPSYLISLIPEIGPLK